MFTLVSACPPLSVCIPYMWAGIHGDGLGLELMCSSTCEMRTRGEGTARGWTHRTPIKLPADITWHSMFFWWYAHTYTRSTPCVRSFHLYFSKKSLHKTDLTGAQLLESLVVQDTSDQTVWKESMNKANTHKKEMQHSQYLWREIFKVQQRGTVI